MGVGEGVGGSGVPVGNGGIGLFVREKARTGWLDGDPEGDGAAAGCGG